ncbi:tyrosine--tRNA ligase [Candidatus Dependentiae bacterium HGW-Dependentiae-1]|nr:MAG: tyrosine--tRNA ligase [Candidatus Dependentiae bacterium HGW-Dependentiae-1]
MIDVKKTLEIIKTGTAQIVPEEQLIKKLETGRPLKIKLGMDPTAPDLHLGHAVVLGKMRQLQDMGHEIIFIIGDFTARIGDPTGKSKTRPPLTEQEIQHNTRTYFDQLGKILDTNKMKVVYNSHWLDSLTIKEFVKLCAKTTVAKIIEREDFARRLDQNLPVGFHELLYPLFQGYDSVVLHADVELGGTDQTFNLLFGRYLQEQFGQEPQIVLTMPLLEGLDGKEKMSKSLGNAIGLTEAPDQAFGKLMSISDTLMWRYFKLLLGRTDAELSQMQERVAGGTLNPMGLKKDMAQEVLIRFWSPDEALKAREQFEAVFQKKDYSAAQEVDMPKELPNPIWIVDLIKALAAIQSSSEARRLIEAGAVSLDEKPVTDFKAEVSWKSGTVVKVGKHRIYRIK